MKHGTLIFFCLIFIIQGNGQNSLKIFKDVKEVKVRSIGVIKTENLVKGYFTFYEYDKADRKHLVYKLALLDENLNELGTKDIEGSKQLLLVSSGYDGKNFCFKFWDENDKTVQLKVYNQEAQEVTSNSMKINYNPNMNMGYQGYSQMVSEELNVAENSGFVDYPYNGDNKGFFVNYVEGSAKRSWSRPYEPEGKSKMMIPSFLKANDEMVLTAVSKPGKGMYNTKMENYILANRVKDGTVLFDVSVDINENHIVPINAVFENDKITIVGLNYTSAKTYTTPPDGLAFVELDKKGNVLKSTVKTFDETLGKYIPLENHKLKDGYYLYIHDIVRASNGNSLVIAEKIKPPVSNIALGNLIVIEYDSNHEIVQAKEIQKEPGRAMGYPSLPFLPLYMCANLAHSFGVMDFLYTLTNEDKSEITFSFVEYEDRLYKGSKKLKGFGQVKYKNGKITSDKVSIKHENNEEADFTHLYPTKTGYLLEASYYKKKKELSMNFIKLN